MVQVADPEQIQPDDVTVLRSCDGVRTSSGSWEQSANLGVSESRWATVTSN